MKSKENVKGENKTRKANGIELVVILIIMHFFLENFSIFPSRIVLKDNNYPQDRKQGKVKQI